MVPKPNYDGLASELADALTLHYRAWIAEHRDDEIYAYIIYSGSLVNSFTISVLSEKGLRQVAAQYQDKYKGKPKYARKTLEQWADELRWSVADSPYCGDNDEVFASINNRLGGMVPYSDSLDVDDPAWDEHIETLYSMLVSALNEFRAKALGGAKRPLLYVDFGDMSDEERLWFIERCNDPESVEWYNSQSTGNT
ncbi:MAG TPA: DUF4303 domain-containing protein [Pirellulales bacterium]